MRLTLSIDSESGRTAGSRDFTHTSPQFIPVLSVAMAVVLPLPFDVPLLEPLPQPAIITTIANAEAIDASPPDPFQSLILFSFARLQLPGCLLSLCTTTVPVCHVQT